MRSANATLTAVSGPRRTKIFDNEPQLDNDVRITTTPWHSITRRTAIILRMVS